MIYNTWIFFTTSSLIHSTSIKHSTFLKNRYGWYWYACSVSFKTWVKAWFNFFKTWFEKKVKHVKTRELLQQHGKEGNREHVLSIQCTVCIVCMCSVQYMLVRNSSTFSSTVCAMISHSMHLFFCCSHRIRINVQYVNISSNFIWL